MGSFLDKPVEDKETEEGEGALGEQGRLAFGASCMQGWRVSMEDAHIHKIGLDDRPDLALFAVFDGHGGTLVAQHMERALEEELRGTAAFAELSAASSAGKENANRLARAIKTAFLSLDRKMRELSAVKNGSDHSGSTAVMCFVTPSHVIVGNCGDSRLLVVTADAVRFASLDHKPYNPEEQARIEAAGGQVSFRRVNGDLAVSRAMGDFLYKSNEGLRDEEQQVSAEPEVSVLERRDTDQCIVVACDGIWDVMSNEEVAEFVLAKMRQGFPLGPLCEDLLDACLDKHSRDNMSAVVVAMPGAPDELGSRSAEDVEASRAAAKAARQDAGAR